MPESAAQERPWPPPQGEWTFEDWLKLPEDGWQYEVIKGVLHMTPAPKPPHQRASGKLYTRMSNFAERHNLGEVFFAPIDVYLPGQETPVQPDLVFLAAERQSLISDRGIEGTPDLVVEILSGRTWWRDLKVKQPLYEETGVRELWILDIEKKVIEVYVLREGSYALLGHWGPGERAQSEALVGFEVAVDEVMHAPTRAKK
ncbi:MAG: hypothetical protein A2Z04_08775 [Chloroflexi bacterium RBG_16_57_9]|nr:MAG: hypothetical protein A2Z04_08775 [Chloroflexi bacterium RBG_16_57_9]